MTAPLPLRATRRGALIGTLAVLATSGCDVTTPAPPAGNGPGNDSSGSTTDPAPDPDEALVERVRRDLGGAAVLVRSAIATRPRLRAELEPFETLHASHLSALDGDRPRNRKSVPGNAAAVRTAVRAREARLEDSLAAAALAAESGPLAALLASMSAAVAQQLATTSTVAQA